MLFEDHVAPVGQGYPRGSDGGALLETLRRQQTLEWERCGAAKMVRCRHRPTTCSTTPGGTPCVGPHAEFADGNGLARRYRPDVSVFHAAADDSPAAWRDLATLATSQGIVVVFRGRPASPPTGWVQVFGGHGHQMVLTAPPPAVPELGRRDPPTGRQVTTRPLGDDDVDAMVALVALTEPGPFRPRTIELGGYIGIFHDDELVAMAGQRLRPPGYCEVERGVHPPCCPASRLRLDPHDECRQGDRRARRDTLPPRGRHEHVGLAVYELLGFTTRRVVSFGAYRVPSRPE